MHRQPINYARAAPSGSVNQKKSPLLLEPARESRGVLTNARDVGTGWSFQSEKENENEG